MTQQPRRAAVSLYAEAFATYRRRRAAIALAASADLADLRCAGEAGLASVVLPVYNGARYVAEALESVLQQTYAQFELIVIDDGSTDSTPRVLAEFAARDPRIRVFRQANQKLPAALNRGFREARGEFLTWISADNRFKPAFLDRMTGALRRHPQWDMVYANMDVIGPEGAPVRGGDWYRLYQTPPGSEHLHLPTDTAELNMWGDNYIGAAFLYRRCVPLLIGEYSPWLFGLEDYDYWMRINALLTLRHTDFAEPVYEYRLHAAALTADPALDLARRRARLVAFEGLPAEPLLRAGGLADRVRRWNSRARRRGGVVRAVAHRGARPGREPGRVGRDATFFCARSVRAGLRRGGGGRRYGTRQGVRGGDLDGARRSAGRTARCAAAAHLAGTDFCGCSSQGECGGWMGSARVHSRARVVRAGGGTVQRLARCAGTGDAAAGNRCALSREMHAVA